jgi:hypothetical protein
VIAGVDAPVITRTEDHRYYYQGTEYPSVTTILKVLDKSGGLVPWAAKMAATAAVNLHMDGSLTSLIAESGKDGAIKACADRTTWERDEAAKIGTRIHDMADAFVSGRETPDMGDDIRKRVEAYAEWWNGSGWRLRLSEAFVVHPTAKYAGTFDLLAYDEDGKTVMADIKTGKAVYHEAALQLAAYAMAPLVARPLDTQTYPMPTVDRHCVIHVTSSGVKLIDVKVGGREELAFLAACDLAAWKRTNKGRSL